MVLTQPTIMGPKAEQRRRTTIYQYNIDRARRSVHGIEQQVAKAEKGVAGHVAIKRNRFVTLTGGTRTVNRELEAKRDAGPLEAVRDQLRRRRPGLGDRGLPAAVADRAPPSTSERTNLAQVGLVGCRPGIWRWTWAG
jgi:hypothetical protein